MFFSTNPLKSINKCHFLFSLGLSIPSSTVSKISPSPISPLSCMCQGGVPQATRCMPKGAKRQVFQAKRAADGFLDDLFWGGLCWFVLDMEADFAVCWLPYFSDCYACFWLQVALVWRRNGKYGELIITKHIFNLYQKTVHRGESKGTPSTRKWLNDKTPEDNNGSQIEFCLLFTERVWAPLKMLLVLLNVSCIFSWAMGSLDQQLLNLDLPKTSPKTKGQLGSAKTHLHNFPSRRLLIWKSKHDKHGHEY